MRITKTELIVMLNEKKHNIQNRTSGKDHIAQDLRANRFVYNLVNTSDFETIEVWNNLNLGVLVEQIVKNKLSGYSELFLSAKNSEHDLTNLTSRKTIKEYEVKFVDRNGSTKITEHELELNNWLLVITDKGEIFETKVSKSIVDKRGRITYGCTSNMRKVKGMTKKILGLEAYEALRNADMVEEEA